MNQYVWQLFALTDFLPQRKNFSEKIAKNGRLGVENFWWDHNFVKYWSDQKVIACNVVALDETRWFIPKSSDLAWDLEIYDQKNSKIFEKWTKNCDQIDFRKKLYEAFL